LAAEGDVVDFAMVGVGLFEVPGVEDGEDVPVTLWPEERAGPWLATVQDRVGDFSGPRRMAGVVKGPLVAAEERGKNVPRFFGEAEIFSEPASINRIVLAYTYLECAPPISSEIGGDFIDYCSLPILHGGPYSNVHVMPRTGGTGVQAIHSPPSGTRYTPAECAIDTSRSQHSKKMRASFLDRLIASPLAAMAPQSGIARKSGSISKSSLQSSFTL
jgi:hypothetical protein